MARLEDCVAVVTGAARGIGEAIATLLANEGAQVLVTDRNLAGAERVATQIVAEGGRALAWHLDVTDEGDWSALEEYIQREYGRLDVLVNNAGVEFTGPVSELSLEDWRTVQAVNVDGVFLGCKLLLPQLRASGRTRSGGAAIINISSIAGIVAFSNQLAYNTSKGAVRHLSKSLAVEFASDRFNIRVNSVHPGCIDTPMLREVFERWAEAGNVADDPSEIARTMAALHPIGRLGGVEDIAYGVLYLASREAGFVTGTELVIDGGWIAK